MNKNINDLLDRDISRKEFLQFIGGGIIVLFGLQNLINYLSHYNPGSSDPTKQPSETRHGFGSSKFGN